LEGAIKLRRWWQETAHQKTHSQNPFEVLDLFQKTGLRLLWHSMFYNDRQCSTMIDSLLDRVLVVPPTAIRAGVGSHY
jgi:hypothetical protein